MRSHTPIKSCIKTLLNTVVIDIGPVLCPNILPELELWPEEYTLGRWMDWLINLQQHSPDCLYDHVCEILGKTDGDTESLAAWINTVEILHNALSRQFEVYQLPTDLLDPLKVIMDAPYISELLQEGDCLDLKLSIYQSYGGHPEVVLHDVVNLHNLPWNPRDALFDWNNNNLYVLSLSHLENLWERDPRMALINSEASEDSDDHALLSEDAINRILDDEICVNLKRVYELSHHGVAVSCYGYPQYCELRNFTFLREDWELYDDINEAAVLDRADFILTEDRYLLSIPSLILPWEAEAHEPFINPHTEMLLNPNDLEIILKHPKMGAFKKLARELRSMPREEQLEVITSETVEKIADLAIGMLDKVHIREQKNSVFDFEEIELGLADFFEYRGGLTLNEQMAIKLFRFPQSCTDSGWSSSKTDIDSVIKKAQERGCIHGTGFSLFNMAFSLNSRIANEVVESKISRLERYATNRLDNVARQPLKLPDQVELFERGRNHVALRG